MPIFTKNRYTVYVHRQPNSDPFYVGMGNSKRPYMFEGRNKLWNRIAANRDITIHIVGARLRKKQALELETAYIQTYAKQFLLANIAKKPKSDA